VAHSGEVRCEEDKDPAGPGPRTGSPGDTRERHFHSSRPPLLKGHVLLMKALTLEGCIIGLFVVFDGLYVVLFPPYCDEAQGYAIIAIGIFIILASRHFDQILEKNGG
jgi:hypothetical protein